LHQYALGFSSPKWVSYKLFQGKQRPSTRLSSLPFSLYFSSRLSQLKAGRGTKKRKAPWSTHRERGVKEINHSQFADDTLLLGSTTICTANRFQKILNSFLTASGGKLNISKCTIYGWHVPGHIKEKISRILGFPIITTWNYFKYMGMSIFLSFYGSLAWLEIVGKISTRI